MDSTLITPGLDAFTLKQCIDICSYITLGLFRVIGACRDLMRKLRINVLHFRFHKNGKLELVSGGLESKRC